MGQGERQAQSLNEFDSISGQLSIVPGTKMPCWEDLVRPWGFIRRLVDILKVGIIVPRGYQFIAQGAGIPEISSVKVWAKFDLNRNPLGWFALVQNTWRGLFVDGIAKNQMAWVTGDSDNPPSGWQPLVYGSNDIDSEILDQLRASYVEISSGRYSYYAVRYVGY